MQAENLELCTALSRCATFVFAANCGLNISPGKAKLLPTTHTQNKIWLWGMCSCCLGVRTSAIWLRMSLDVQQAQVLQLTAHQHILNLPFGTSSSSVRSVLCDYVMSVLCHATRSCRLWLPPRHLRHANNRRRPTAAAIIVPAMWPPYVASIRKHHSIDPGHDSHFHHDLMK